MSRTWQILAAVIVVLGVFAVYWQTAGHGLIILDDYDYVVQEPEILGGLTARGLVWCWRSVGHAIWMPLTWISYMVDVSAGWGYGGMHLHSVAIHAVNGVLVFAILGALLSVNGIGGRTGCSLALAGALLWALHPLRVESVAWIASRKDVLSFLFESGAVVCWIAAGRREIRSGAFVASYCLSLALFALGALAKPSVMTFPLLMLAVDTLVVRRVRPWAYILPGLMAAAIGLEASFAQAVGGATSELGGVPLAARLVNAMSAFGIYVTNTLAPFDLAVQCIVRHPGPPRALATGVVLSFGVAAFSLFRLSRLWRDRKTCFARIDEGGAVVYAFRGTPDFVLAGLLWFCIGLGPVLGIANFGYHAFADRFTYIPSVGLVMIAMGLVTRLARGRLTIAAVVLLALAAPLGAMAERQVRLWGDETDLWRQTLRVDGDGNFLAHVHLALAAFEFAHDVELADSEFRRVRELHEGLYADFAQTHVFALCERGLLKEADETLGWWEGRLKARQHALEMTNGGMPTQGGASGMLNVHYAQVARLMCDTATRDGAKRLLAALIERYGETPVTAYLHYRLGVVIGDESLRKRGMEELRRIRPTDFLQFRYLNRKENGK